MTQGCDLRDEREKFFRFFAPQQRKNASRGQTTAREKRTKERREKRHPKPLFRSDLLKDFFPHFCSFCLCQRIIISLQIQLSSLKEPHTITQECFCATLINTHTTYYHLSLERDDDDERVSAVAALKRIYITLWIIIREKKILQFLTKNHESNQRKKNSQEQKE